MKRSHTLVAAAALLVSVTACDGLKEAFTAHVDVVARAGSQELSTERLGAMIGNSQIPVSAEVVKAVADLWVNYQLVALAAARGDSLNDPKAVDEAMWAQIAQSKARKFFLQVSADFEKSDTTGIEARYAQGEYFAAQHILFGAPREGLSAQKRDSIRRAAEAVRRRATSANFADLAREHSMDPGSAQDGGKLGVFPPGAMVPEFEAGVRALQPGEVSAELVESDFGFHIIRRQPLAEVRDAVAQALVGNSDQRAEQAYYEQLETEAKVTLKTGIADKVRAVAKDPEGMQSDKFVLATTRQGDFTAGKLARWILAFPPQSQIRGQLQQGPDDALDSFVKAMVRNDLLVKKADEAKVQPDEGDLTDIRGTFRVMVMQAWAGLNVEPQALNEGGNQSERERLAASRVDDFVDNLLRSGGQGYVDIPQPLADMLRAKYSYRVVTAGLDRVTERATMVRAAMDSARGGGGGGGAQVVPMGAGSVPMGGGQ
jgi:hypothetical protein